MTASSVDENVNSRFKVLERPSLSPGKCAVCGAVDRAVVDFGLNIQYYGAVMLCVICLYEGAERVGMIRPETHSEGTLQTGQSISDYLEAHNLKVISNGLHSAIFDFVARCATEPSTGFNGLSDFVDSTDSEGSPDQFELDFGEPPSESKSRGKRV